MSQKAEIRATKWPNRNGYRKIRAIWASIVKGPSDVRMVFII